MSDRYGDIQTQNDLDLHLREADCCGVPLCPVPTMEIECKSASLSGSYLWPYQITGGLAADELIPRLYDTEATTFPAETVGGTMTRTTNTQSTDTTGSKYQQIVGLLLTTHNHLGDLVEGVWQYRAGSPSSTPTPLGLFDFRSFASAFGLAFSEVRAAGYLCDLTTETTKTYSFGREEIADQGTDPGVPGPPPYGNSVKVTSDGVYWEKTRRMETLSDVLSVQDALDQVDVDLQSAEFSSTGCNGSQFERTWPRVQDFIDHHGSVSPCPPRGRVSSILVQKDLQRFRFAIPQTFTGVYFKITWDIVFYPEGSDPHQSE